MFVPFERDGRRYTLIDTAGVRRRARVEEAVENFSVIKTLQAIDSANVVIGVIDAHDTVARTGCHAVRHGRRTRTRADHRRQQVGRHSHGHSATRSAPASTCGCRFFDFAPVHFISALHGTGVGELMEAVSQAYDAAMREMPTPELTRVLEHAIEQHQPPLVRGRRIKLRYAHQGGRNPPMIIVHGNQTQHVPDAYRRYLANLFRKHFRLEGAPVRVEFRADENPFKGRRNPLTPRQVRSRKRILKRVKR